MCGFVGMVAPSDVAPDNGVALEIHLALQALQHRGQDSAGIATMVTDGSRFVTRRGLGTATHALGEAELKALEGPIGIGHVRYPTIGRGRLQDAQPFFYRQPGILMAHNGNITNYGALRESLLERSIHLLSSCDIEPALCEMADALMRRRPARHTEEDAVAALGTMRERVSGAYSLAAGLLLDGRPTLLAMRDVHGVRPCVVGHRDDGSWMVASESVALDVLGFQRAFEPAPGEVCVLRAGEQPRHYPLAEAHPAPCSFEFVYFARPDAVIEGRSVYETRLAFGRELATRITAKGLSADVVVAVPDTARPAAVAIAEAMELPLREGLIKNRYSGRTFIMPSQIARATAMRLKLNPLPNEIRGRRVLLVDDSIVRGTTLRRVISLVRDAGATEVHLAIHSPPVRHPCYYGIDMSTEEELFARRFSDDLDTYETEAAQELGVDSLTHLAVEGLDRAFGGPRCAACFDGEYPEGIAIEDRAAIASDRRSTREPEL